MGMIWNQASSVCDLYVQMFVKMVSEHHFIFSVHVFCGGGGIINIKNRQFEVLQIYELKLIALYACFMDKKPYFIFSLIWKILFSI